MEIEELVKIECCAVCLYLKKCDRRLESCPVGYGVDCETCEDIGCPDFMPGFDEAGNDLR